MEGPAIVLATWLAMGLITRRKGHYVFWALVAVVFTGLVIEQTIQAIKF